MQVLAVELAQKLDALGETLEQQGKRLKQLGEQQASLKESLREIREAVGSTGLPPRRHGGLSVINPGGEPWTRAPGGGSGKVALLATGGSGQAPLAALFGSRGKKIVRQAIVDGTMSAGIQELSDFLKQIQEFLENILKIIDTVRQNLEGPASQAAVSGLPALSKNTVEVMAKMIKMPEFQRLVAGFLTQALRD